jgi:hypothetical protein
MAAGDVLGPSRALSAPAPVSGAPPSPSRRHVSKTDRWVLEDKLCARISDGREDSIPIAWLPRLINSTPSS